MMIRQDNTLVSGDITGAPKRKPMRLPEYDYGSNGCYFVTICTNNRRNVLGSIVGGGALDAPQMILSDVGKIADRYIRSSNNIPNIKVDKYVIMPNHIHLIVRVDDSGSGVNRGTSGAARRPTGILSGGADANGAAADSGSGVNHGTSRAPSPTNILSGGADTNGAAADKQARSYAALPHFVSTLKRFINRDVGSSIFQRSFHDHVIRDSGDYLAIWEYIDTNPAKWADDEYNYLYAHPKTNTAAQIG